MVARVLQHLAEDGEHLRIVVHQQDAPLALAPGLAAGGRLPGLAHADGQRDREGRALAGLALDPQVPAVPLHDRMRDGKPEPGALLALGGEEGIEHALAHVLAHAHAGVGHRDHRVTVVAEPRADL